MSDKVRFDISGEFEDKNYKSCFARSVAVNSQFKQTKSLDFKQPARDEGKSGEVLRKPYVVNRPLTPDVQEIVRMRKNSRNSQEDSRRFSCSNINSARRISICTSRITEIPVENIVNQSKIETLQWQLKEIQKSREMYRAVMKQVVTYLEKAHHSLELLGSRINRRNSVHRSKSEHQIMAESSRRHNDSTIVLQNSTLDGQIFKDFSWKPNKDEDPTPDEIPPDKLAQEAFRLLRTAQSLMNTREPDLVQVENHSDNDIEFLAQIAKEFPTPEPKPQRATSFSLSPKLILPDNETRISNTFSRKFSLPMGEARRYSKTVLKTDSSRGSVAESDVEFPNEPGIFATPSKTKSDKSNSPANGSISSVEDESGFSSMNSFQEVGLPVVNSTMTEEVSTKSALLRSMIQNNSDYAGPNATSESGSAEATLLTDGVSATPEPKTSRNVDEVKLWRKSAASAPQHKRWFSSPAEDVDNQSMKVLWV